MAGPGAMPQPGPASLRTVVQADRAASTVEMARTGSPQPPAGRASALEVGEAERLIPLLLDSVRAGPGSPAQGSLVMVAPAGPRTALRPSFPSLGAQEAEEEARPSASVARAAAAGGGGS